MQDIATTASLVGLGLLAKILFDWLKGSKNHNRRWDDDMPSECRAQLTRIEASIIKTKEFEIEMLTTLKNIYTSLRENGALLVKIIQNGSKRND